GAGQMRWSVSANTRSGGFWLAAFPASGVTDAAQPLVPQIRVDVDPSGLESGVYYGSIAVVAPDADNSPQSVSVVLTVVEPGSIGPIIQPLGLSFTATAGGGVPGSQIVRIQNTRGTAVTFTTSNVVVNREPLYDILPSAGTVV